MKFTYLLKKPETHIFTPIAFAMIMNALIYKYKLLYTNIKNPNLPPGYIIGTVWIVILGILGYVHYQLYKSANYHETPMSKYIIFVILFCISYPILVYIFPQISRLLDVVTFILAIYLIVTITPKYQIYISPFFLWSFYVMITECVLFNYNVYKK